MPSSMEQNLQRIGSRFTWFELAFCITILPEKLRCRNIVTVDWSSLLHIKWAQNQTTIIQTCYLVVWSRPKVHCLSHVSISRRWSTLIGRLGSELPPTAVDWSALDQIDFLRDGEQHYSILQSDALRWVLVRTPPPPVRRHHQITASGRDP